MRVPIVGLARFSVGVSSPINRQIRVNSPRSTTGPDDSVVPHAPEATTIGKLLAPHVADAHGRSGARLLIDGLDAFALHAVTARAAEQSIDSQYYIWRNDATGIFIAHELLLAADRGVKVRLLLDDMDARPRDDMLMALDRHENIDIRLFNPFRTRRGWLRTLRELLSRASRLNHRMHNKSWLVDDQLAIVGGRNIGDEYFAASEAVNFVDVDVALIGPAVDATRTIFEEYWTSETAKPIGSLRRTGRNRLSLADVRRLYEETSSALSESPYARRVEASGRLEALMHGDLPFQWSEVDVVADDPRKALRRKTAGPGVLESLNAAIDRATNEVLLISSYFVPGVGGTVALRALTRRGAVVAVLTNSLAATDVAAVHSGYSRYRQALLEGGIRLFELKPTATGRDRDRLRLGSSRASLHTKAVIVDGEVIFVGSFNLDPRSAELNCEMGVWIRSKPLTEQLRASYNDAVGPEKSFEATLDPKGRLSWIEVVDGLTIRHGRDPRASLGRRLITRVLGWLPIESQL